MRYIVTEYENDREVKSECGLELDGAADWIVKNSKLTKQQVLEALVTSRFDDVVDFDRKTSRINLKRFALKQDFIHDIMNPKM